MSRDPQPPLRRRRTSPMMLIAALVAVAITTFWKNTEERRPATAPESVAVARPSSVPAAAPPARRQPDTRVGTEPAADRLAAVVRSQDEREALVATLTLIERGGPFPYPGKDGSTFGNREGRLPRQPRGYYREYTVPTRNASNRGARRIVSGREGERWYTRDHYETFTRIDRSLD